MANRNQANDNTSQFFITLDKCPWLDNKHTIFGKIEGNTIYNLLAIGEVDTNSRDFPLEPVVIRKSRVELNPFEDIEPREDRIIQKQEELARLSKAAKGDSSSAVKGDDIRERIREERKKKSELKVPVIKNKNLLSFGDDEEEEEPMAAPRAKGGIRSSHDSLQDPRLLKEEVVSREELARKRREREEEEARKDKLRNTIKGKLKGAEKKAESAEATSESTRSETDRLVRKYLEQKRIDIEKELKNIDRSPSKRKRGANDESRSGSSSGSEEEDGRRGGTEEEDDKLTKEQKEELEKTREEYSKLKADLIQFKKLKLGSRVDEESQEIHEMLTPLQLQRY